MTQESPKCATMIFGRLRGHDHGVTARFTGTDGEPACWIHSKDRAEKKKAESDRRWKIICRQRDREAAITTGKKAVEEAAIAFVEALVRGYTTEAQAELERAVKQLRAARAM